MIGRALAAQQTMALASHTLGQGFEQPRLAHPGLARQQHDVSISMCRALPGVVKKCQLALTPDDRTGSCSMRCRKPALGCALTQRFPDGNRLAKTLDRVLAGK